MNFGVTGVNQKEELLKQLKTISEALDKQTEKKVSKMRPVIDFNGNEIYTTSSVIWTNAWLVAPIIWNTAFIVGRNLIGVRIQNVNSNSTG